MNNSQLSDLEITILREIKAFKTNEGWMAPREIELAFGDGFEDQIKESLLKLSGKKLIKGWGSSNFAGSNVYSITPTGKSFLADLGKNLASSIGNITNSNVVINSSNVIQSLKIEDSDIKEKVRELEEAIQEKDASKIKRVFGYIADKSVDVAIALLIRGMGQ